ncbi:MAG: phenylacetate-CoA oxygenase subunit PaaI [Pseudomonadota bacterium]|jgi:ring-1,2-phenylacetyl-CoA epoxidase subunit PaaC
MSLDYILHLADNAVVLGQRNAEWCGHGPILEEDIALSNMSLDHIGQARLLYQHASTLIDADPALQAKYKKLPRFEGALTEDSLAYFRDVPEFRNYTLLELPHNTGFVGYAKTDMDYGATIVRNYLFSQLMVLVWAALQSSSDAQLAAIAAKSLKETGYHLRHSRDWLVRLGDGSEESHARVQAALDYYLPFTQEFWTPSPAEQAAQASGVGVEMASLKAAWDAQVDATLLDATLRRPATGGYVSTGKLGLHSEHLGYLLGEMQSLARAHPTATW